MMELPGSLLAQERIAAALDLTSVASAAKIAPGRLRAFEIDRAQLHPFEIERLIAILGPTPANAERIRHAAGIEPILSLDTEQITVFSATRGGIDPWAQALYSTDMGAVGTRLAAQGYLSSAVRPVKLTLKQYAWDGASEHDLSDIADVLKARQDRWVDLVQHCVIRDVYPKNWIERYCSDRIWLGHRLEAQEVALHLAHVEAALRTYPNYFIGLMSGEELYFNFVIEGGYVLVEGAYAVEPEPTTRLVSGLRICKPDVVEAFRREFERIWHDIPHTFRDRENVISWFHDQRQRLES